VKIDQVMLENCVAFLVDNASVNI